MATIDRIESAYAPRSASASRATTASGTTVFVTIATDAEYFGRHRRRANRVFSLRRMFYLGRHRRR